MQPYALRYLDDDGALHDAADFIGEMSFVESVVAILRNRRLTAELIRLPAMPTDGTHRRELALAMRDCIATALSPAVDTADNPPAAAYDQTSALQ